MTPKWTDPVAELKMTIEYGEILEVKWVDCVELAMLKAVYTKLQELEEALKTLEANDE